LESKNELIFTALSELVNIKSNIYGDILNHLANKFEKIHVICLGGKTSIKTENNITYYSGKLTRWFSFFNKINKKRISHIFITDFFIGGIISTIYSKIHKIPLIYRCGGPWRYSLSPTGILKSLTLSITKPIVIKSCKKIVYNSKAIIQKQPLHNYEVVYNGVDTNLFKPIKKQKVTNKLNLLFIGRLFHEKGIDYLLKAIKGIHEKVHLSLVGDGEKIREYQRKYPSTKFYGRVNKELLPEIINQHDILILPSLTESFPNVLLEAMACGKPVIATNIFGIPEMVTHGINGFLVPQKNSKAIEKVIQYFLKNPKQIKKMGMNAHKIIKERFEKEKQMEKLYKGLFEQN
jgi:glycosyltransferase involved in cell wall biosynthesis